MHCFSCSAEDTSGHQARGSTPLSGTLTPAQFVHIAGLHPDFSPAGDDLWCPGTATDMVKVIGGVQIKPGAQSSSLTRTWSKNELLSNGWYGKYHAELMMNN